MKNLFYVSTIYSMTVHSSSEKYLLNDVHWYFYWKTWFLDFCADIDTFFHIYWHFFFCIDDMWFPPAETITGSPRLWWNFLRMVKLEEWSKDNRWIFFPNSSLRYIYIYIANFIKIQIKKSKRLNFKLTRFYIIFNIHLNIIMSLISSWKIYNILHITTVIYIYFFTIQFINQVGLLHSDIITCTNWSRDFNILLR